MPVVSMLTAPLDELKAKAELLEQLLEMAAVKKDDVTVSEEDHWVMLSTLDYADEKNDNGTPSMLLLKLRTSTT